MNRMGPYLVQSHQKPRVEISQCKPALIDAADEGTPWAYCSLERGSLLRMRNNASPPAYETPVFLASQRSG